MLVVLIKYPKNLEHTPDRNASQMTLLETFNPAEFSWYDFTGYLFWRVNALGRLPVLCWKDPSTFLLHSFAGYIQNSDSNAYICRFKRFFIASNIHYLAAQMDIK